MDDILKFAELADAQQLGIELLVRFQNFLGTVGAWCVLGGGGGGLMGHRIQLPRMAYYV